MGDISNCEACGIAPDDVNELEGYIDDLEHRIENLSAYLQEKGEEIQHLRDEVIALSASRDTSRRLYKEAREWAEDEAMRAGQLTAQLNLWRERAEAARDELATAGCHVETEDLAAGIRQLTKVRGAKMQELRERAERAEAALVESDHEQKKQLQEEK